MKGKLPGTYLELCSHIAARNERGNRTKKREKFWLHKGRWIAQVAILAAFGILFLAAAFGIVFF